MSEKRGFIYVLDMESALADPLIRRIQDMQQYHIFRKWDMEVDAQKEVDTYKGLIKGFIISGSAKNINSSKIPPPQVPAALLAMGVPTLAICYGMQYIGHIMGVPIVRCWDEEDPNKRTKKTAKNDAGEQGVVAFERTAEAADCPLFAGLGDSFPIWMKHNWMLADVPQGWTHLGRTAKCPVAAISAGNVYALQFHPEPGGSLFGRAIIHNFITRVCDLDTPYF